MDDADRVPGLRVVDRVDIKIGDEGVAEGQGPFAQIEGCEQDLRVDGGPGVPMRGVVVVVRGEEGFRGLEALKRGVRGDGGGCSGGGEEGDGLGFEVLAEHDQHVRAGGVRVGKAGCAVGETEGAGAGEEVEVFKLGATQRGG